MAKRSPRQDDRGFACTNRTVTRTRYNTRLDSGWRSTASRLSRSCPLSALISGKRQPCKEFCVRTVARQLVETVEAARIHPAHTLLPVQRVQPIVKQLVEQRRVTRVCCERREPARVHADKIDVRQRAGTIAGAHTCFGAQQD